MFPYRFVSATKLTISSLQNFATYIIEVLYVSQLHINWSVSLLSEWIRYRTGDELGHTIGLEDESSSMIQYIYMLYENLGNLLLSRYEIKSNQFFFLKWAFLHKVFLYVVLDCTKHTSQMCFDSHTSQMCFDSHTSKMCSDVLFL